MEDTLIWNDDKTMCFMASAFNGARIQYPDCPADKGKHWVRVYLRGSFRRAGRYQGDSGLLYESCDDEEPAKKSLERLVAKLRHAGLGEASYEKVDTTRS